MITQSIPESLLLPNAKLQLYPFLVRRKNAKDYFLMRLGCRTVTVLTTTQSGVVASRLLKSGCTAAEVSVRISSMFKCRDADIQPLLKALYKARMIRSIDGQTVETDVPSLQRQLKQRLEWIRIRAGAAMSHAFIRSLPVSITHRTMETGRLRINAWLIAAFIRSLPVSITHRTMCFLRLKWSRSKM